MKIFIFKEVEKLTENWHGGGGLVIIAPDMIHVLEMALAHEIILSQDEIENVLVFDLKAADIQPQIFIFPDAGCC